MITLFSSDWISLLLLAVPCKIVKIKINMIDCVFKITFLSLMFISILVGCAIPISEFTVEFYTGYINQGFLHDLLWNF